MDKKKNTDHPRLELYLAFPFLLAVSTTPTHPQTQNVIKFKFGQRWSYMQRSYQYGNIPHLKITEEEDPIHYQG